MLSEAAIHAWQFSQPRGTAVDKSNNNVYVVDNILNSDLLQHLSGLHLENLPGGGGGEKRFSNFLGCDAFSNFNAHACHLYCWSFKGVIFVKGGRDYVKGAAAPLK